MKTIYQYLPAAFLSCAMFCTGANAMQLSQWDKLSDKQKLDFKIVLIAGTINNLKATGHADQIRTLTDLFFNNDPKICTGPQELQNNIGVIRQENAAAPANYNKLEVEAAFYLTLSNHGINIPYQDLLAIGKTYQVPTAASGPQH